MDGSAKWMQPSRPAMATLSTQPSLSTGAKLPNSTEPRDVAHLLLLAPSTT
jgi:hypothetical protein